MLLSDECFFTEYKSPSICALVKKSNAIWHGTIDYFFPDNDFRQLNIYFLIYRFASTQIITYNQQISILVFQNLCKCHSPLSANQILWGQMMKMINGMDADSSSENCTRLGGSQQQLQSASTFNKYIYYTSSENAAVWLISHVVLLLVFSGYQ